MRTTTIVIVLCFVLMPMLSLASTTLEVNTQNMADAYGEMVAARKAGNEADVKAWSEEIERLYNENRKIRGQSPLPKRDDDDNDRRGGGQAQQQQKKSSRRTESRSFWMSPTDARVYSDRFIATMQFIFIVILCICGIILVFAI